MQVYTLEMGRVISKDGEPLVTVARYPRLGANAGGYNLTADEADALGHRIVALLNSVQPKDV